MNLPLTSVTGLTFESSLTGRSENGASLFHTWWSTSIISSEMRTYTYFVCLCDLRWLLWLRQDGASPIPQDMKKTVHSRLLNRLICCGNREFQSKTIENLQQCFKIRCGFVGLDPCYRRLWYFAHGGQISLAESQRSALLYHCRHDGSNLGSFIHVLRRVRINFMNVILILIPGAHFSVPFLFR